MDNLVVHWNVVNGSVNNRNRHFYSDRLMMHNWLNVVSHGFVNDKVLGWMALLNDRSVMMDRLIFILVMDDLMMAFILRGIGTLTMLDLVVGVRSCGIYMIRQASMSLNLLFFLRLGIDRLVMYFLGIDSGSGGMISTVVTINIA